MRTTTKNGAGELSPTSRIPPGLLWSAFVVIGAAIAWFAWMGWDQSYWDDPVTGVPQGPYRAWQVVGCTVTLLVVTIVTASRRPGWQAVFLLPPAFTAAWSWTAAADDASGLWAVGAFLILCGTGLGVLVVLVVLRPFRTRDSRTDQPSGTTRPPTR